MSDKALESYNSLPDHIKNGDLFTALSWARDMLHAREGVTIEFRILPAISAGDPVVYCDFGPIEWSNPFEGPPCDDGTEAILMSVCEYLAGHNEIDPILALGFEMVNVVHIEGLIPQPFDPEDPAHLQMAQDLSDEQPDVETLVNAGMGAGEIADFLTKDFDQSTIDEAAELKLTEPAKPADE